MILSRAKPAIGGEKAEEKGGSAGRKQVVPHIILFSLFSSHYSNLFLIFYLVMLYTPEGIFG